MDEKQTESVRMQEEMKQLDINEIDPILKETEMNVQKKIKIPKKTISKRCIERSLAEKRKSKKF